MQRMGDQRFAGAGLAVDQHVTVGLAQVQDVLAQPLHGRGNPDQLFHQLATIGQLAPQLAVVHDQAAGIRRLLGQLVHPFRVEGLFQEIESAQAHRLNRHGHVAMAGDHDHGQRTVRSHQLAQELHPVHAGHLDVGNHDPGVIGTKRLQRVLRAREGFGVVPGQGQPLADRLAHILLIVDDGDLHGLLHFRFLRSSTLPPRSLRSR